MPIHDWTRVEAGIFHAFHHGWIEELSRALNQGILPDDYYALPEQHAAGFGPDVLTLQGDRDDDSTEDSEANRPAGGTGLLLVPPQVQFTGESELEFYRRKQKNVVVRHVAGDRIVAMVEVVSPGNKASRAAMRAFVQKATSLLEQRVHLLILDLHPPGRRDPQGIHAAIWDEIAGAESGTTSDKPFTLASYESPTTVRYYVERCAVGDPLPGMPLFLEPGAHVAVPLERTYLSAFAVVPRRWRVVLDHQP